MIRKTPLVTRYKIITDVNGKEHKVVTSCTYPNEPSFDEIYDKAMKQDRLVKVSIILGVNLVLCITFILLYIYGG